MSIRKKQYENTPEEIRKVRNRVREYLKARGVSVNREELLRVANKAGIKRSLIFDAANWIQNLEDYDDIDVLNWWGYENGGKDGDSPAERKTLWLKYHEYDPELREATIEGLKTFDEADEAEE